MRVRHLLLPPLAALLAGTAAAAPTLTSTDDQYFFVGDSQVFVIAKTITDDAAVPEITAANDIRLRIPAGFGMTWLTTDSVATIFGSGASKVSTTVTFEDADQTVVFDVTSDFAASDQIIMTGLAFTNFAVSAFDNMELEVANDGNVTATDDKTIAVLDPVPTRSTAIEVSPDGQEVWVVNPDHGSVSVIGTQGGGANTLLAEIPVAPEPWTVDLHPFNGEAWVTSLAGDGVWILDVASRTVIDSISVGFNTFAVAFNPQGTTALVTSSGSDEIFTIDVDTRTVTNTLPVYRRPRGVAWRGDGDRAWVSHLLMPEFFGRLTTFFVSTSTTAEILVNQVFDADPDIGGYPSTMQNIAVGPDDTHLWIPADMIHTSNGSSFGNPMSATNVAHAIIRPVNIVTSTDLNFSTYLMSNSGTDVGGPIAVDFKSGRAYVANLHSDNVTVLTDAVLSPSEVTVIPVGRAPIGIVTHPGLNRAYVANWLTRDVTVINTATNTVVATVPTTSSEVLSPQVLRGKTLFFTSSAADSMSANDRVACATCHVFGKHDSRPWDLSQFGKAIRATPDLRGIGWTGAHDWTADKDEMQDHNFGIQEFAFGPGLIPGGGNPPLGTPNKGLSADLDNIGSYMATLVHRKDTPFAQTANSDSGQVLFNDPTVGCANCHSGPFFTDSNLTTFVKHDVGTADSTDLDAAAGFDTPSLVGAWDNGPYLHHALALSLEDVMTIWNPSDLHGTTSQLSTAQVGFIADYIRTIGWPDSTGGPVDAPLIAQSYGSLESPFPNPFHENTSLRFAVEGSNARVRIDVYDVTGRHVRTLIDRTMTRGSHVVGWDSEDDGGRRVTAGVYFARYVVDGGSQGSKKMVVLR